MYSSTISHKIEEIIESLILLPKDTFPKDAVQALLNLLPPAVTNAKSTEQEHKASSETPAPSSNLVKTRESYHVADNVEEEAKTKAVQKALIFVMEQYNKLDFIIELVELYEPCIQFTDDQVITKAKNRFLEILQTLQKELQEAEHKANTEQQQTIILKTRNVLIIFIKNSNKLESIKRLIDMYQLYLNAKDDPVIDAAIAKAIQSLPSKILNNDLSQDRSKNLENPEKTTNLLIAILKKPLSSKQLTSIAEEINRFHYYSEYDGKANRDVHIIMSAMIDKKNSNIKSLLTVWAALVQFPNNYDLIMYKNYRDLLKKLAKKCQSLMMLPGVNFADIEKVFKFYCETIAYNRHTVEDKSIICECLVNIMQGQGFQKLTEDEKNELLSKVKELAESEIKKAGQAETFENVMIKANMLVLKSHSVTQQELTDCLSSMSSLIREIERLERDRTLGKSEQNSILFNIANGLALLLDNKNITPTAQEEIRKILSVDFLTLIISARRSVEEGRACIPALALFNQQDLPALQTAMQHGLRYFFCDQICSLRLDNDDYKTALFAIDAVEGISEKINERNQLTQEQKIKQRNMLYLAKCKYELIISPARSAELLNSLPPQLAIAVINNLGLGNVALIFREAVMSEDSRLITYLLNSEKKEFIASNDRNLIRNCLNIAGIRIIAAASIVKTAHEAKNISENFYFYLNSLNSDCSPDQQAILIALLLRLLEISEENSRKNLTESFRTKLSELSLPTNDFNDLLLTNDRDRVLHSIGFFNSTVPDVIMDIVTAYHAEPEEVNINYLYDKVHEKITQAAQPLAGSSLRC